MSEEELNHKAAKLAESILKTSAVKTLCRKHKPIVHNANFGTKQLGLLELLNVLEEYRLESIFPNLSVSLRMFLTAPTTLAYAEMSFSKLKLIKNYLRSTMSQDRLNNLTRCSIESGIAKQIEFDTVICSFAKKKARQALF